MNYEIKGYPELQESLEKYSIEADGLLCFLPENLKDAENTESFIYSETTTDLNKVFKKEIQKINYLTDDKPLLRSRKSADWFGPTILVGGECHKALGPGKKELPVCRFSSSSRKSRRNLFLLCHLQKARGESI